MGVSHLKTIYHGCTAYYKMLSAHPQKKIISYSTCAPPIKNADRQKACGCNRFNRVREMGPVRLRILITSEMGYVACQPGSLSYGFTVSHIAQNGTYENCLPD